jgi:hypothetical protein
MPPKREEVKLFDDSRLVQQGDLFDEVNTTIEESIVVLDSGGETFRVK